MALVHVGHLHPTDTGAKCYRCGKWVLKEHGEDVEIPGATGPYICLPHYISWRRISGHS